MSKAREWADKHAAIAKRHQPVFTVVDANTEKSSEIASVDTQGDFRYHATWLSGKDALALARWILETFEEPKS